MAQRTARRRLRQNEPLSTHDLILAEAMRLIARDGVEEMKIKDIAEAVGIQIPSIYKHFVNRDGIVAKLAHNMAEELATFLKPDPQLPPEIWIKSWAKGLVWFFATRPAYARIVLRDIATPGGYGTLTAAMGPPSQTRNTEPLKTLFDQFDAAYARGVKARIFKSIDPSMFYSTMYGVVLVPIAWPYSRRAKSLGAADLERLQSLAASVAYHLATGAAD